MIQVVHGKKGSGKTKRIIDMANNAVKEQNGIVVFIDDDNRYMFDVQQPVRFVNAGEYGMSSPEMFYGFLCGMASQNFDISYVVIDAFLKLVNVAPNETEWFFQRLTELAEKNDITFVLSVSCDDSEAPDYIQKHFI
ncbi:MAG: ATP-binding protein [Clostridiales bacterium]|nr:ATP-binding protein [Clostridiales bacterium]